MTKEQLRAKLRAKLRTRLYSALTSGKYQQVHYKYREQQKNPLEYHYCIIGLAYKVMGGTDWSGFTLNEVTDAYGLRDAEALIRMNDEDDMPFLEMAEFIKKNPRSVYIEEKEEGNDVQI